MPGGDLGYAFRPTTINHIALGSASISYYPGTLSSYYGFADWWLEIPSRNVAINFVYNLYPHETHGAMALARRIMETLSVSGPTTSATH